MKKYITVFLALSVALTSPSVVQAKKSEQSKKKDNSGKIIVAAVATYAAYKYVKYRKEKKEAEKAAKQRSYEEEPSIYCETPDGEEIECAELEDYEYEEDDEDE